MLVVIVTIDLATATDDLYKLFYGLLKNAAPSGVEVLNSFPLTNAKFPIYILPRQRFLISGPLTLGRRREFPVMMTVQMMCTQNQKQKTISDLDDAFINLLLSADWDSHGLELITATPAADTQKIEVNKSPLFVYEVEVEFRVVL
jgi:hypothetical protein